MKMVCNALVVVSNIPGDALVSIGCETPISTHHPTVTFLLFLTAPSSKSKCHHRIQAAAIGISGSIQHSNVVCFEAVFLVNTPRI